MLGLFTRYVTPYASQNRNSSQRRGERTRALEFENLFDVHAKLLEKEIKKTGVVIALSSRHTQARKKPNRLILHLGR